MPSQYLILPWCEFFLKNDLRRKYLHSTCLRSIYRPLSFGTVGSRFRIPSKIALSYTIWRKYYLAALVKGPLIVSALDLPCKNEHFIVSEASRPAAHGLFTARQY